MQELIFTLHKKNIAALGTVRCMNDLKVAADENYIWIRGLFDNTGTDKKIKGLPIEHTFFIDEKNLLFSTGCITPVATLPVLNWLPIAIFVTVLIPVAALPGQLQHAAGIRIIPSEVNKKSAALLTLLAQWKAYADTAPAIRLAELQFAVSQKSEVLIIGDPLPPIPGKELWMADNILLPNGYDFEIPMAVSVINEKLNAQKDAVLLFDINGSYQKIELALFVKAKRSAVRLTQVIVEQ